MKVLLKKESRPPYIIPSKTGSAFPERLSGEEEKSGGRVGDPVRLNHKTSEAPQCAIEAKR